MYLCVAVVLYIVLYCNRVSADAAGEGGLTSVTLSITTTNYRHQGATLFALPVRCTTRGESSAEMFNSTRGTAGSSQTCMAFFLGVTGH